VVVSFIDGGYLSTQRKPLFCVGIAREDQLKVKLNGHLFARTKFVYFYNNLRFFKLFVDWSVWNVSSGNFDWYLHPYPFLQIFFQD
jgi:hypothetical protein